MRSPVFAYLSKLYLRFYIDMVETRAHKRARELHQVVEGKILDAKSSPHPLVLDFSRDAGSFSSVFLVGEIEVYYTKNYCRRTTKSNTAKTSKV